MILRRMANGIRHQDWFTVVLEVLIVVVGIFQLTLNCCLSTSERR